MIDGGLFRGHAQSIAPHSYNIRGAVIPSCPAMKTPLHKAEAELSKLFDEYSDAIFRYVCFRMSDREIAKDITQDTFVRYWQCLAREDDIQNPKALLYKIAGNLVIDYFRKKKETVSLDALAEDGFEPGQNPFPNVNDKMELDQTIAMFEKLDDPYKKVLILRFVEGFDPKEIAEILEETPNSISVRIHRGLQKLRTFFPNR